MNEIVVMARLASNQLDAQKAPLRFEEAVRDAILEYKEAFQVRSLTFIEAGNGWQGILLGDPTLLRMMVSNLLSNAVKATPNGGEIVMCVEPEDTMLHLMIRDTG